MRIAWKAWGTTVRVEVTDPAALPSAHRLVAGCIADAERAADVDQPHAELFRLVRAAGREVRVSATLARLVGVALDVAARTGGVVDPTVGAATLPLRRARRRTLDRGPFPTCAALPWSAARPAPGSDCLTLTGHRLRVPATVSLDLTATAKAATARTAARRVAEVLGVGALVEIGGDVATAGPARGPWLIDPEHGAGTRLEVPPGWGAASCRTEGLVDPATGRQVEGSWGAALAVTHDVVEAKAAVVTALLRGEDAGERLGADVHLLLVPSTARATGTVRSAPYGRARVA